MQKEDQLPIEDMTLEQVNDALYTSLDAFIRDYRASTKAGKARARKASLNIEKLFKRYRKLTV